MNYYSYISFYALQPRNSKRLQAEPVDEYCENFYEQVARPDQPTIGKIY